MSNGLLTLAQGTKDMTQVVPRKGMTGIKLDDLGVVGSGLVPLEPLFVRGGPLSSGLRVKRFKRDGTAVSLLRLEVTTGRVQHLTQTPLYEY